MSCHRHGYPWPSLAISPYRSSPLASLQGYIPYPHIAAICMFELVVLLLPGCFKYSIRNNDKKKVSAWISERKKERDLKIILHIKWFIQIQLHQKDVTYSYACRNIVNTIMTNETQFFRKIYLSHFIRNDTKGLCVRGELETEQRLQHIDPQLFWL